MNDLFDHKDALIQPYAYYSEQDIQLDIKREDLLHPEVSGNKLRKLKYNLIAARELGHKTLLTYGGAFSNHIAATAAAGKVCRFKTIGVIRGEELGKDLDRTLATNKTLRIAHQHGMRFHFITRTSYQNKNHPELQESLKARYGNYYDIPEGGTNELAVKGTREILVDRDLNDYDVFAVAAGTGGTAAGIIQRAKSGSVYVYGALKGDFLKDEIAQLSGSSDFQFYDDTLFGGYARSTDGLIQFLNLSYKQSQIPLETIYTGKMIYRLDQQIKEGCFQRGTRILAIHTGGLQSIAGFNDLLRRKGKITLDYERDLP